MILVRWPDGHGQNTGEAVTVAAPLIPREFPGIGPPCRAKRLPAGLDHVLAFFNTGLDRDRSSGGLT